MNDQYCSGAAFAANKRRLPALATAILEDLVHWQKGNIICLAGYLRG